MNAYRMHALKQKKDSKECYCALCRTPRVLRYERNLSKRHYIQIALISLVLMVAGFSFIDFKVVGAPFLVWLVFESIHKSYYRRDLVCPFCGFDPTWYRKDVKLARRKVEEFLSKNPESAMAQQAQKAKQKIPSREKNVSAPLQ
jgi:hypothetical protein